MKVLWFTNIYMPEVHNHFGKRADFGGGWMSTLLNLLKSRDDIELGVVTAHHDYPDSHFTKDSVEYFTIYQSKHKFQSSLFPEDSKKKYLIRCIDIIKKYKPDIIHIHGTERFYGKIILCKEIDIPVLISIQGIIDSCSEWYRWFGKISFLDILKFSFFSSLLLSGPLFDLFEGKKRAKREKNYFIINNFFQGRTEWDRAYTLYFNSKREYYYVSEAIRRPFWETKWDIEKCSRHRIIFTNIRHPRKGVDLIIEAVKRLKNDYKNLELVLIGSIGRRGYGGFLKAKFKEINAQVRILPRLDGLQMASELGKSHLFISASYIDNSPNSVAEAQLIGMPVISSYTGGTPTMVEEGKTGLLFPTGDVPLLVAKIKEIFENDKLAVELGRNARNMAKKRHDPDAIVAAQINAYHSVLKIY